MGVIDNAQEALKAYIKEAENLLEQEEKTESDLVSILAKEAEKAYLVSPI